MIVVSDKCDYCNRHNSECIVFEKIVLWYFVTEVKLCQRCVATSMKLFTRNK